MGSEAARGHRIAVVGAGIAGLAAAYRLQELARERSLSLDLILLEAGQNLGGTIGTERSDGFVIEAGPDSFISEKPWALDLCQRIGLWDRLVGTRDEHRQTFIVRAGTLWPLPEGFLLLAPTRFWPLVFSPLFSWPGKLRMALDLLLPRGPTQSDEALASFIEALRVRNSFSRLHTALAPQGFTGLTLGSTPDVFVPLDFKPLMTPGWDGTDRYDDYWLYLFARLAPGITSEQAETILNNPYRGIVEVQAGTVSGLTTEEIERHVARQVGQNGPQERVQMIQAGRLIPLPIHLRRQVPLQMAPFPASGRTLGGRFDEIVGHGCGPQGDLFGPPVQVLEFQSPQQIQGQTLVILGPITRIKETLAGHFADGHRRLEKFVQLSLSRFAS